MAKGEKTQAPKQVSDDLELYRRLIEIQKQLVTMAKKHEQTKLECDALRERMARDLFDSAGGKGKRFRLRHSVLKLLKRLPRATAAEILRVLKKNNQPSSC